MFKNIKVVWVLLAALAFTACKEIPPYIDYTKAIQLSRDTTYVVNPLPDAQTKNVLIEDISGVRCVNCPEAAEMAHEIKDANDEGRIVVVTLHTNNYSIYTRPIKDTFNTEDATLIVSELVGNINGLPTGAVDRKLFNGKSSIALNPTTWESYADQQLVANSKVNLELEVVPTKADRSVIANVKATFLEEINENVHMTVMVTESHIISPQKSTSGEIEDYEHNFILRTTVTPYNGILLSNTIEAGRVFEKGFEFEIPEKWDFDNCSIVVLINKVEADDHEVLQTAEVEL